MYKYTHTLALNGELLKNKNNNYDQLMTEVCVWCQLVTDEGRGCDTVGCLLVSTMALLRF